MKSLSFIVAFLLIATASFSQSIWHALPSYKEPALNQSARLEARILGPTDSLPSISTNKWTGVRFAGPDLMLSVPDLSAWTGIGLDYVIATANKATGKWDYNTTIGLRVNGGANLGAPGSIKMVGGFSARVSFFKGLLAIGAIYNLTTKKPQLGIGNPAALIPGLN